MTEMLVMLVLEVLCGEVVRGRGELTEKML